MNEGKIRWKTSFVILGRKEKHIKWCPTTMQKLTGSFSVGFYVFSLVSQYFFQVKDEKWSESKDKRWRRRKNGQKVFIKNGQTELTVGQNFLGALLKN